MIYTITLNPALDYIMEIEEFENGKINRAKSDKIFPGGKGINVSIVLNNLGLKSTTLGFIGGFTGEELKRQMEEQGIQTDFIKLKRGKTRINVKINSKKETELNSRGPEISKEEAQKLLEKVDNIQTEDIVVIAGNIPDGIDKNIYETICAKLQEKKVTFIVDTTGEKLINILKYKPFLIKPNRKELEETFKTKIKTNREIIEHAKKLQMMGAQNVLISLGRNGAILVTKHNKVFISNAPKGKKVNTVGSGDSMVAGFISGYKKNKDYEEALKMSIATGSASAFSEGLATKDKVDILLKKI